MTFGERLKYIRKSKGLTIKSLSKLAGCGLSCVWSIETNQNKNPGILSIKKLSDSLNVSIDYLVFGIESECYKDIYKINKFKGLSKTQKNDVVEMMSNIITFKLKINGWIEE